MKPYYKDPYNEIYHGDCLQILPQLPEKFVNTCVTSPPYFNQRDYLEANQIGLEEHPKDYVDKLVKVFQAVRRVLRDDGTVWLNLGDSYTSKSRGSGGTNSFQTSNKGSFFESKLGIPKGYKAKDLMGIPWSVALALRDDGWYLRSDIIWFKPACMPESCTDRPTKTHEYIFLLAKSEDYYYDQEAILEPVSGPVHNPGNKTTKEKIKQLMVKEEKYTSDMGRDWGKKEGRNKRSVWVVNPAGGEKTDSGEHYATFPQELITPCILAGSPAGGMVLDPFCGSATTLVVARKNGRRGVGTEISEKFIKISIDRLKKTNVIAAQAEGVNNNLNKFFS